MYRHLNGTTEQWSVSRQHKPRNVPPPKLNNRTMVSKQHKPRNVLPPKRTTEPVYSKNLKKNGCLTVEQIKIRRVFGDNLGIIFITSSLRKSTKAILMSTHNMFLWRIIENYPSIIIKYPLYLFHCLTKLL